ncbi:hypothetical protein ASPZODRAFT_16022 [Penicilliopsis zonata CBS 506.65]|uniref:Cytochrome P450 monooxygenase n=1 Tax=Penicilliopsis zonata CBS 506.65 TaxID=1073090 RepID=A0A1L9SJD5_9EURO|nr:hypothetical protein ASPZODRAFT_16022 [Penicilliopsis zonata CBS 506.65]OJJ47342.1 hypothetical protein ASPZODRAFT_16022 [Penicilliopsis zonata CBS 506.65]
MFDIKSGLLAIISLTLCYFICQTIYNIFFHPLSRFPGPVSHAISRIPYCYRLIQGTLPFDMLDLHRKYGDIVRIAPDELAFSHPDAWKGIMGHKNGEPELEKAHWFYRVVDEPLHIANEDQHTHKGLRRTMAHGFSERSMRDQEPIIRKYVHLLLQRLRENSADGHPVVMSDWYNFTTFDIIGDLAFGESFGCLEGSNYDSWIKGIFEAGRLGTIFQSLSFFPLLKTVLLALVPKSLKESREYHKKKTREKMMRRLNQAEERSDLIEGILKKREELNLGLDKIISNAEILIIGGSETTASLLSGVTYLLLQNPDAYKKLVAEVRSVFTCQEEINLVSVGRLTYMMACLEEGLRMYPPIANGLPRVAPKGGVTIMGEFIPEGTNCAIHQWALYHREKYFEDPETFHPERFLADSPFDDRKDAFQPFHFGPRNCLGRNLAYSEMRLILALILFNFDLKLAEESQDWIQQKNFLMWQKGPLKVFLKPVN